MIIIFSCVPPPLLFTLLCEIHARAPDLRSRFHLRTPVGRNIGHNRDIVSLGIIMW